MKKKIIFRASIIFLNNLLYTSIFLEQKDSLVWVIFLELPKTNIVKLAFLECPIDKIFFYVTKHRQAYRNVYQTSKDIYEEKERNLIGYTD